MHLAILLLVGMSCTAIGFIAPRDASGAVSMRVPQITDVRHSYEKKLETGNAPALRLRGGGRRARKFIKKKPTTSARNQRKKDERRAEAKEGFSEAGGGLGVDRQGGIDKDDDYDDGDSAGKKGQKKKYIRRHRYGTEKNRIFEGLWDAYDQAWDPEKKIFDLSKIQLDVKYLSSFVEVDAEGREYSTRGKKKKRQDYKDEAFEHQRSGQEDDPHARAKALFGLKKN